MVDCPARDLRGTTTCALREGHDGPHRSLPSGEPFAVATQEDLAAFLESRSLSVFLRENPIPGFERYVTGLVARVRPAGTSPLEAEFLGIAEQVQTLGMWEKYREMWLDALGSALDQRDLAEQAVDG